MTGFFSEHGACTSNALGEPRRMNRLDRRFDHIIRLAREATVPWEFAEVGSGQDLQGYRVTALLTPSSAAGRSLGATP